MEDLQYQSNFCSHSIQLDVCCHFLQQFLLLVSMLVTMGTAVQLFSLIFFLQDFLEDLWSRVQDLSNNGWKLDSGNGALFFMNFSFWVGKMMCIYYLYLFPFSDSFLLFISQIIYWKISNDFIDCSIYFLMNAQCISFQQFYLGNCEKIYNVVNF